MKPNIFVCGPSGRGKSTSMRNLDPATTVILNTERKALPFRHAKRFDKNMHVTSLGQFQALLRKALGNESIKTIVIESFTSLVEIVYQSTVDQTEGFEGWAQYYKAIEQILLDSKRDDKTVIFLGLDDDIKDENGVFQKTIAVQGKWFGKVEKEFEIVLWATIESTTEGSAYRFMTNSDGRNSAKSPMGMFDDKYIDNDLNNVLTTIEEYYNDDI